MKTPPYTLVVIDMQPDFEASGYNRVFQQVSLQIRRAKDVGARIIFVEYAGHLHTWPELTKIVERCSKRRVAFVTKTQDGGGEEIDKFMRDMDWPTDAPIKVCGVNTSYCVRSTVLDLVNLGYNDIELLYQACSDPCRYRYEDWYYDELISEFQDNGVRVNGLCIA